MARAWLRYLAVAPTLLVLCPLLSAADLAPTTIVVKSIHCQGCANRIVAKLAAVPGVAAAQADVKTATATVKPRENATLSPKALWEAMEKSGHKPVKLEGPSGTFTEKPTS